MINNKIENTTLTPIPEDLFKLPDTITIKKGNNGYGLFSLQDFKAGEVVYTGKSIMLASSEADRVISFKCHNVDEEFSHIVKIHAIPIGGKWEYYGFDCYMNHSCFNNVMSVPINNTTYKTVSVRPIATGEEITCNYNALYYEEAPAHTAVIICNCQSANCEKEIRGFKYLHPDVQKALLPYIDINVYNMYLLHEAKLIETT